jgi:phosphoribosyl 1,2-cyclic phosphodiesterase
MSLAFCVLASGSAGNCTVVQAAGGVFLLDAGLSPRRVMRGLATLNRPPSAVTDIVLTHLDWDHLHPGWPRLAQSRALRFHIHRRHRAQALRAGLPPACLLEFDDGLKLDGGVSLTAALLAHDESGSVGFVIEHGGTRLGYATDLGRVPASLFDLFRDVHGLALESNYDPAMQRASTRPAYVKRRIMGGSGHLSNEQCLEAVIQVAASSRLSQIALLHLSRQCNCPKLVRSLYEARAPGLAARLTITSQHAPTPLLRVHRRAAEIPAHLEIAPEPMLF